MYHHLGRTSIYQQKSNPFRSLNYTNHFTFFQESTGFYEPIVKKKFDSILEVPAIVLANLCVSYIMTSQNEEAEELMRKIEKEQFNSVNIKWEPQLGVKLLS